MPANVTDYHDLRVVRWTGMMFRKFNANPIRVLPMRPGPAVVQSLSLQQTWRVLTDLLSEDHLALAMWEAL